MKTNKITFPLMNLISSLLPKKKEVKKEKKKEELIKPVQKTEKTHIDITV